MIPEDFPIKTEIVASGEHGGYPWVAARAPLFGAVNGYCRLPDDHPWLAFAESWEIANTVPWGEITYRAGNWVGFDTLHAGQAWPGGHELALPGDRLMTEEMVVEWAERLARDAKAAESDPHPGAVRIGALIDAFYAQSVEDLADGHSLADFLAKHGVTAPKEI